MARLIRHPGRRDLLGQLHNDFDRLLTPLNFGADFNWAEENLSEWVPSIDVKEDEKQYIVYANVPGVKAEDIDVSMEKGVLTIKGANESEKKEEKENYLRIERSSGSFMRQFSLPETIDEQHIEATCNEGVLEIKLPKLTQSVGKKIKVKKG